MSGVIGGGSSNINFQKLDSNKAFTNVFNVPTITPFKQNVEISYVNVNNSNIENNSPQISIDEYFDLLKSYGITDIDINRVKSGEITLPELLKEIDKDPERVRLIQENSFLKQINQNSEQQYESYSDFVNVVNNEKEILINLVKERNNINDSYRENDTLQWLCNRLKQGEDLQFILESAACFKYKDEYGNDVYIYPDVNDGFLNYNSEIFDKKAEEVTFEEFLKDSELYKELKNTLSQEKRWTLLGKREFTLYTGTSEQDAIFSEIEKLYEENFNNRKQQLEDYDKNIETQKKHSDKLSGMKNYVDNQVDYYINNIHAYTSKDDFLSNSSYDRSNKQVLTKNLYEISKNEDYIVDFYSCLINGEIVEKNGVLKDKNGKYICDSSQLSTIDNMLDNYLKWGPFISDTEKNIFNYILNTEGTDKAYNYLESISDELDNRWLSDKCKNDKEFAQDHEVLASIGSIFLTPVEGINAFAYSINSKVTGEKIRRSDVYSKGNVWRQSVSEEIHEYSSAWGFIYDTGMSMADSGLLIAASAMTGGSASLVLSATLMGSRAYVSTLNEALDRGLSDNQAILLAASSAIVETAMESYSVGHLMNLEEKLGENTLKLTGKIASKISNPKIAGLAEKSFYILASSVSQGIAEGEEEFCTELLNYGLDIFISKDLSNYAQSLERYISEGKSEEEAMLLTMKDFKGQLEQAFLGGFASGVCFGAFGGANSTMKTSYGISNDMYKQFLGDNVSFSDALEFNQQQRENLQYAADELARLSKNSEVDDAKNDLSSLTKEQIDLLNDGTVEQQAGKAIKTKVTDNFIKFGETFVNQQVGENQLFTVKDFAMILPDIGLNIFNLTGRKSLGTNLTAEQNQEVLNKIKEDGIIHITSDESANKILDSNYVKKTKAGIQSYGSAKSFFFAGTPTIEGVAFNLDKLKPVMTGVRIRPTDAQMNDLKVRLSDGSIFNKGDFKFENGQAEQVYYGLTFEDGNLVYKEISAEQAQNYQPDVTPEQLKILQSKWALGLKTFISGMQADRVKLLSDIQKYKGQPVYNEVTEQLGTVEINKKYADDNMIVDGMSCHMLMPDLLIENLNNKGITDVFTIQDGVYVLKDVDANTKFQVLNAITDFVCSSTGQMVLEDDAALAAWNVGVGKDINSRGNMAKFLYNQGKVEQANTMLTNLITKVNDFRQDLMNGSIEQVEQIETLNVEENVEVLEVKDERPHFILSTRKNSYNDLNNMSFEQQAEFIKNCHNEDLIGYIWQNEDIMKNHKELIKEKIISNQDYYCSRLFDLPYTFSKMGEFYSMMYEDNVLSRLNNRNLSILLMKTKYSQLDTSIFSKELEKRIANGSNLIDFSSYKYTVIGGLEIFSTEYLLSAFGEATRNELIDKINNDWNNISDYCKTPKLNLNQKAILINLWNNKKINEQTIELINKFYENNPLALEGININFEMFNSDILNVLGEDLVMEFAPYSEMSTKIISLYNNNPQLLKMWVDAYNQFYQDNSLNNVMLKAKSLLNYFYENQNNLAGLNNDILINDSFINYVLYDNVESYDSKIGLVSRIKLDYSQNYEQDFLNQCDEKFSLSEEIKEKKDYYCQKYFKMSYAEINYIMIKYLDNLDSLNNLSLSEETQIFIEDIKRIIEIDSVELLNDIYSNREISLTVEETMAIEQELRECYMSAFVEKLSTTSNKLNNSEYEIVDYNGKQLRVIATDDNFSFFVHSSDSGFVVEKELVNNSFKETWRQIAPNTHGLSTSYISDINIGSAPVQGVGVLYAFTDINSDDIQLLAPYDVNSHIANYGFSSGNKEVYMSPDELSENTLRLYNEVVLNRKTVKPNYIIIFDDMSLEVLDNSYKAASEWNIPIVKIDKTKLVQNQMNKVSESLNQFKESRDLSLLTKAIELYDSAVAGYNLNIDHKTNKEWLEISRYKEVITNTTNNQSVIEILNTNNPTSFINDYINYCNSESDLIALKQYLNDLKSKYDLMNQNGTMIITRTKSTIDIDTLLSAIDQQVENLKNQNLLNCSKENFSTILNQLSQKDGQIFIDNLSVEEFQIVLSKVSKDNYVAFSSILSEDAIINNIDKINQETFDKLIEIAFSNPYTALILSQNEIFLNAFVQRSSDSVFKSVFESGNGLALKLFNKLDNTRLNNILGSIQDKNCFDSLFKDFYNTETILAGEIESIYAYSVLKSNGFNTNDVNEYFSWLSNEHAYNISVSFATSIENNNGVYNIRRTDGTKFDLTLLNTQELSNGNTIYSYEYSSIDDYGGRSSIILYFDFNLSFMLDENIGVERLVNDYLSMDRLQQSINNFGYLGSYKLISGEYEQVINSENISLLINETANQYYDFLNSYYDLDAGTTFGVDQHGTANMAKVNPVAFKELCDKFVSKGLNYRDAIKLMKSLDNTGACSYASVCNTIFAFYKDNPPAFKNDFGFDMFTYNSEKNYYSLNTTELLADLYLFVNNKSNNPAATLFEGTEKIKVVGKTWLGDIKTNEQQYLSGGSGANIDLIDNYLKSKNSGLNFNSDSYVYGNTTTNLSVEQINEVRKIIGDAITSGKTVGLGIYTGYKDIHGTNVKKGNVRFINSDGNVFIDTNRWSEGDGHAVFITKVVDNGVWVSSWGKKLFISFSDLQNARFTFYLNSIDGFGKTNANTNDNLTNKWFGVAGDLKNNVSDNIEMPKLANTTVINNGNNVSDFYEKLYNHLCNIRVNFSNEANEILKKIRSGEEPNALDLFILNNSDSLKIEEYKKLQKNYEHQYKILSKVPDEKKKELTIDELKINEMSDAEKLKFLDTLSNEEYFNLVYFNNKDLYTYTKINPENVRILVSHSIDDGILNFRINFPGRGGLNIKYPITSFKTYVKDILNSGIKELRVTRTGDNTGTNFTIELGTNLASNSERAIPTFSSFAREGVFNVEKYLELCDFLENIKLNSLDLYSDENINEIMKKYPSLNEDTAKGMLSKYVKQTTTGRALGGIDKIIKEMYGVIKDGNNILEKTRLLMEKYDELTFEEAKNIVENFDQRLINEQKELVRSNDGYVGSVAPWKNDAIDLKGEATQFTAPLSWKLLVECDIITSESFVLVN